MSKINYCSLDEAWGDPGRNINDNLLSNDSSSNVNPTNNVQHVEQNDGQRVMLNTQKNTNNDKIYGRTNYDYLNENSKIDRNNVIQNMNKVERNLLPENINNNGINYNKYRFNPRNNVKQNNYDKDYAPFKESIEKKQLQDKIDYLESEFNKYKLLTNGESSEESSIENFNNQNKNEKNDYNSNDIVDLIILIIIGLIVIFIMNSIFNIGKAIGMRNKMM